MMLIPVRFIPLVLALGASASSVDAATLPLQPGDYVRAGVACGDAPLAAHLIYDGANLSSAHAGGCTTNVLGARHGRYVLASTCLANGDGSPATPYTEQQTVTVRSPTRFAFGHRTEAARFDHAEFRWCGSIKP